MKYVPDLGKFKNTTELIGGGTRVERDSMSPLESRLITVIAEFPRPYLAELNTHRVWSKNSASSRARPTSGVIRSVLDNPYIPEIFGANQSGMQSERAVGLEDNIRSAEEWIRARDYAIFGAIAVAGGLGAYEVLADGSRKDLFPESLQAELALLAEQYQYPLREDAAQAVHKQFVNRLLEPFSYHTVVISATEWSNFNALRDSPKAQPEMQILARAIKDAISKSTPLEVGEGEYHLPFTGHPGDEHLTPWQLRMVSTGRCARVSHLTHDGHRDTEKDLQLAGSLHNDGHMSPLEHVARPMQGNESKLWQGTWKGMNVPRHGNFRGWHQLRKDIKNEDDFSKRIAA